MRPARTARVGVDIGGTFTDLVLHDESRQITRTGKLLTTPDDPGRGVLAGIQRLLRESAIGWDDVATIVHGTTLITNTVLERTGAEIGLITTEGFRDVLEMGGEIRFDTENLFARPAPVLVPRNRRLDVPERVLADGTEHLALDEEALLGAARTLLEDHHVEALAVAFLHSYRNPAHERRAREVIAAAHPEALVTLSCEVAPEIREYERMSTACVNAYVQPRVHTYLDRLEGSLRAAGFAGRLYIMLSGGGLTTVDEAKAFPVKLLESGPAAGAIAAAYVARTIGEDKIIAFDVGGTTAKMSVVEDGTPALTHRFEAGRLDKFKPGSGLPLRLTVVDMIEIGAGGGSIAGLDDLGLLKVGPRSAGSDPGPVAYGLGGTMPTVTDADLVTGRLDPDHFLGGEMSLVGADVRAALKSHVAEPLGIDVTEAAVGIQSIAADSMAAATRMHLAEKGGDPSAYTLVAFGGAGPVHAYSLARMLKIGTIVVPMGAGVMSALGFLVAAPTVTDVRGYPSALADADWAHVGGLFAEMEERARALLAGADEFGDKIVISRSADMRYVGQGYEIEVPLPDVAFGPGAVEAIHDRFLVAYASTFGRTIAGGRPEVISWRMTATLPGSHIDLAYRAASGEAVRGTRRVHFEGHGELETTVYDRYALPPER
ncbi:hydantoinase/oxoprolinase family protein [Actinomadura madurae]|uniref:hydantoinase/oxoprolinase family protein n=1 Tax=Actinomadura madurae TaxID=1993 RepID=UPI0020D239AD|nr:hydantoinase/oxoprolinase family protein [Actinomadura madurae]MCP9964962.1 hydantoinase/oxoprolinase family protein [Actinomadura madurae]